eukprot:TRINITY_DN12172_c0_g1_i1.p1 TRINITY_DN12172_c0_g1~~TRINITY_DN12172_c0_g1_i1.p1  ORF type:complete len:582 (+),score=107.89 TRINITY_DN12172_c0_g1_i1:174-1919(+)
MQKHCDNLGSIFFQSLVDTEYIVGPAFYSIPGKQTEHFDARPQSGSFGFGQFVVSGFRRRAEHPICPPDFTMRMEKQLSFGEAAYDCERLCGYAAVDRLQNNIFYYAALQQKAIPLNLLLQGPSNPFLFDEKNIEHSELCLEALIKQNLLTVDQLQRELDISKIADPVVENIPRSELLACHGDLKPHNFLWKQVEQKFGLADWDSARLVPRCGMKGSAQRYTPAFAAPEIKSIIGPGQDVYAAVVSALAVSSGCLEGEVPPAFVSKVYRLCVRLQPLMEFVFLSENILDRTTAQDALTLLPMSERDADEVVARVMKPVFQTWNKPKKRTVTTRKTAIRGIASMSEEEKKALQQQISVNQLASAASFELAIKIEKLKSQVEEKIDTSDQLVNDEDAEQESSGDGEQAEVLANLRMAQISLATKFLSTNPPPQSLQSVVEELRTYSTDSRRDHLLSYLELNFSPEDQDRRAAAAGWILGRVLPEMLDGNKGQLNSDDIFAKAWPSGSTKPPSWNVDTALQVIRKNPERVGYAFLKVAMSVVELPQTMSCLQKKFALCKNDDREILKILVLTGFAKTIVTSTAS